MNNGQVELLIAFLLEDPLSDWFIRSPRAAEAVM